MLRILKQSEISRSDWSLFVETHPRGSVFQTYEMFHLCENTQKWTSIFICAVNEESEILGILVAVIQKEHTGFLGRYSSRSIIWGGPLVKDNRLDVLDFILTEYNKRVGGKVIYSQFRNLWTLNCEERNIFSSNGYRYEDHLDILIDLRKSEEELLKEMHKGRRKNIGRAERIPLLFSEIDSQHEFDSCIDLIESTYKRVKLPSPDKSYFNSANKIFSNKAILKKFVVKYNEKIISCRFVLCYNELVYDWYAGTDENHLDKYPNDYLPWKILQWSKANGYSTFDFGGAGKPTEPYGVRDYKLKFGGELVCPGRFQLIHKPFLYRVGLFAFKVFQLIRK